MKVEDLMKREREEGELNQRKMWLNLISLMARDNRGDEIVNLSSDSKFLEEMRVYYHI